jgi:DNA primase
MRQTTVGAEDKVQKLVTPGLVLAALDLLEVGYKDIGSEIIMPCIFHNDTGRPNLSMNIDDKPGVYRCFSCKAKGEFLSYLVQLTEWPVTKALSFCRKIRKEVEDDYTPVKTPKSPPPDQSILEKYAWRHNYLYERGLTEETLQRFDIGFDKESNSLTIPWFDRNGNLVAIKKRNVVDKRYKFSAGADLSKTLFGLNHVKPRNVVWLTEGEIDAMTLDQVFRIAHFENFSACALGGKELHSGQVVELVRRQPSLVVLMLDNDEAGTSAQKTVKSKLIGDCKVVEAVYPPGPKDPNAMTYEQVLQTAKDILKRLELKCADTGQQKSSTTTILG